MVDLQFQKRPPNRGQAWTNGPTTMIGNRGTRAEIALSPLRSDPKRSGDRHHETPIAANRANRRMRSGRLGNDNEGGESPARHGCRQHRGNHGMRDGLRRPIFPAQPAEPARQHRRFICRAPGFSLRTIYSACLAGTPRPDLAAGRSQSGIWTPCSRAAGPAMNARPSWSGWKSSRRPRKPETNIYEPYRFAVLVVKTSIG